MNRKSLSERDICTQFIAPAITAAGWDIQRQVREAVSFTRGRTIVRGNQTTVCQPTTPKWRHTVERLKAVFGVV